ncbi:hypothetical protein D3C84_1287330 [compost metagenome]
MMDLVALQMQVDPFLEYRSGDQHVGIERTIEAQDEAGAPFAVVATGIPAWAGEALEAAPFLVPLF